MRERIGIVHSAKLAYLFMISYGQLSFVSLLLMLGHCGSKNRVEKFDQCGFIHSETSWFDFNGVPFI